MYPLFKHDTVWMVWKGTLSDSMICHPPQNTDYSIQDRLHAALNISETELSFLTGNRSINISDLQKEDVASIIMAWQISQEFQIEIIVNILDGNGRAVADMLCAIGDALDDNNSPLKQSATGFAEAYSKALYKASADSMNSTGLYLDVSRAMWRCLDPSLLWQIQSCR